MKRNDIIKMIKNSKPITDIDRLFETILTTKDKLMLIGYATEISNQFKKYLTIETISVMNLQQMIELTYHMEKLDIINHKKVTDL